jgi:two-component system, chemotaxis family, chemotaxis protein CheY
MPEMNGLELLQQVRKISSKVQFMMLTMRSDASAITDARNAGVTSYIIKPFTPLQLQQKMAVLIENLLISPKQDDDCSDAHEI